MTESRAYPVPYGLNVSVKFRREDDTTFVDVYAPMYMTKKWTMPHQYRSSHFTDAQILNDSDFVRVLINYYGVGK